MMSTIFPNWPHMLFAVIKPISILIAVFLPIINLPWFINQSPVVTTIPDPNITMLANQLSNIYGVTFLLSVGVCYGTTEPKVLRNFVVAPGIGDVGHCLATYLAMGHEAFVDIAGWNFLTWANFGFSLFLLVNRVAYLFGVFGLPKVDSQKNWFNISGQFGMILLYR